MATAAAAAPASALATPTATKVSFLTQNEVFVPALASVLNADFKPLGWQCMGKVGSEDEFSLSSYCPEMGFEALQNLVCNALENGKLLPVFAFPPKVLILKVPGLSEMHITELKSFSIS